ncbi:hypothetical protein [Hufsiella ginkgonis]|uniref:Uncharacterized protein n=1 Tax=Hufsiella ginkgonis TaxID=2695274 RepID=A0A7K1Y162_9SPHI|nr:hypothetical protein [Hufsiella ginkgonis]MXV16818.1 hypothetical protein [Hufsiella ginkgonis]
MMKHWTLATVIACLLLAVGAIIYAFHEKSLRDQQEEALLAQKKTVQAEATIIARKVDKEGLEHVTIAAAENIISASHASTTAVSVGILDTTAMAIGILKKQIENLTLINTTLKADNLRAKMELDEKKRPVYSYSDKYLDLAYRPGNPTDSADRGSFDFKYNADLNITQYWKRRWFLGAKKSFIDIYSNDPRTTVNGVKRLSVVQNEPRFGLRVQGVTGYNLTTGATSAGPGIQFDFKRFSFQGSYQYNFQEQEWRPGLQTRVDLVRF